MGHIRTSYTTSVDHLTMATRYDFNVFSFESDLAVGIFYKPVESNQSLKLSFGLKQGLGLLWETVIGDLVFGIGAKTELNQNPHKSLTFNLKYSVDI